MTDSARTCACCPRSLRDDETGRHACYPCTSRMLGWLTELEAQLVVLRASLTPDTGGPPRIRRTPRTPRSLVRLDVLSLLGTAAPGDIHDGDGDQGGPLPIATTLGAWAGHIAALRHLATPPRTPERLALWLRPHLDWATAQPWVADLHAALGDMMRTIRGITRVRPQRRPIKRPCPNKSCQSLALVQQDWEKYIECGACGSLFTQSELEADAPERLAALQFAAPEG